MPGLWHLPILSYSGKIQVNNSFEFTLAETFSGGIFLEIANCLTYKCCNDLINI